MTYVVDVLNGALRHVVHAIKAAECLPRQCFQFLRDLTTHLRDLTAQLGSYLLGVSQVASPYFVGETYVVWNLSTLGF